MSNTHLYAIFILFQIALTQSYDISTCIPKTPCQCSLTKYSLTLLNCSHTLSDIPIFFSKTTLNITKLIARNTFIQWPSQLCKYKNLQILDLSGSYFDSQSVDLSCLKNLIHLNLSNTQLNRIPNFNQDIFNHLQILDLSNNNIKIIDGKDFQILDNLISLLIHNNPIESIENLSYLFKLKSIQSINLISSYLDIKVKENIDLKQWIQISNQWIYSKNSLSIRTNNIPLQNLLPNIDQLEMISIDSLKAILQKLINSSFSTLFNTPKCNCRQLKKYQRVFSLIEYSKKYTSALFQHTKCLMSDEVTHARLFDRRTYIDLRCPLTGRSSLFPFLSTSSSSSLFTKNLLSLSLMLFFFRC